MAHIRMNFLSEALRMQTNVNIIIPSLHNDLQVKGETAASWYRPGMKFQVLWLLHGGAGDDSDYITGTNIARYAQDNCVAVVMPADYNASYHDDPTGAKYFTYVADELPLVCRTMFPFSDKPEDNFVAGLSMGAGGTFKLAVAYPERYNSVLCMSGGGRGPFARQNVPHSPAPRFPGAELAGINDPWNYVTEQVQAGKKLPRFFMTCGTADELAYPDYLTTSEKLRGLGCDVFTQEVPGYKHEWDFWDLSLRKALNEWLPLKRAPILE